MEEIENVTLHFIKSILYKIILVYLHKENLIMGKETKDIVKAHCWYSG